jgi:hypothetical protein
VLSVSLMDRSTHISSATLSKYLTHAAWKTVSILSVVLLIRGSLMLRNSLEWSADLRVFNFWYMNGDSTEMLVVQMRAL